MLTFSMYIFHIALTNREDTCKLLVDVYGANIDIRDFSGKTALHHLRANHPDKAKEGVCFNY